MKHNKLVRDKIPEICKQNGATPVTRILDDAEYKTGLDKKLQEEVAEFLGADDAHELEELADVLEVIYAIADQKGSSQEALETLRKEKATKRGGFKDKIFLIETIEKDAVA